MVNVRSFVQLHEEFTRPARVYMCRRERAGDPFCGGGVGNHAALRGEEGAQAEEKEEKGGEGEEGQEE
jgi:hypothetical protein